MKPSEHPQQATLVEFLDGELARKHADEVSAHLADCPSCRRALDELRELSAGIRNLLALQPALAPLEEKPALLVSLAAVARARNQNAARVLRRFGWGMAAAALLALALLLVPERRTSQPAVSAPAAPPKVQLASLDVNGEAFVPLPYSNPDLPVSIPRIVEMQVPVASLTAAGIAVGPAAAGSPDRTVRANVLLGIDGQPLGLHVLNAE